MIEKTNLKNRDFFPTYARQGKNSNIYVLGVTEFIRPNIEKVTNTINFTLKKVTVIFCGVYPKR